MRLLPDLKLVSLPLGKIIYERGSTPEQVYFPVPDCIISLHQELENGASAEIAKVGCEGFVGVALLMAGGSTTWRAVVQSAGNAFALKGNLLQRELQRQRDLQVLLLRYSQALITQVVQTAVCNRHHGVEQQLCRWLLLSLDRVSGSELFMTQELIASMLGVRRRAVTKAAGKLRIQGAIAYSRGRIEVLDRSELEARVCECYAVVKNEYQRLLSEN